MQTCKYEKITTTTVFKCGICGKEFTADVLCAWPDESALRCEQRHGRFKIGDTVHWEKFYTSSEHGKQHDSSYMKCGKVLDIKNFKLLLQDIGEEFPSTYWMDEVNCDVERRKSR